MILYKKTVLNKIIITNMVEGIRLDFIKIKVNKNVFVVYIVCNKYKVVALKFF